MGLKCEAWCCVHELDQHDVDNQASECWHLGQHRVRAISHQSPQFLV
jgi:hypothetical protein